MVQVHNQNTIHVKISDFVSVHSVDIKIFDDLESNGTYTSHETLGQKDVLNFGVICCAVLGGIVYHFDTNNSEGVQFYYDYLQNSTYTFQEIGSRIRGTRQCMFPERWYKKTKF